MELSKFLKAIFNRCRDLIIHPKDEWNKISEENVPMNQLFRDFLIPLIVIATLASILGQILGKFSVGFDSSLLLAVGLRVFFGFLIATYLSTFIVDELVRIFGGNKNMIKSSNLVVYSLVPTIVASAIIGLIPSLYALGAFVLYSFYLFYIGVPILFKMPEHRVAGFFVTAIVVLFLVFLLINLLLYKLLFAIS